MMTISGRKFNRVGQGGDDSGRPVKETIFAERHENSISVGDPYPYHAHILLGTNIQNKNKNYL